MSSWERWEAPKQIMALREEMERVSAPTTLHVNPLCPQEAYNLSRKTGHTRKPTLLIFPLVFATKDLNKWLLTRNDFLMDRVSHNMMMPRGDAVCTAQAVLFCSHAATWEDTGQRLIDFDCSSAT